MAYWGSFFEAGAIALCWVKLKIMQDQDLLRYSRQIMLPEMDVAGQQRLAEASVLVVGMGGLGCPAAMYLAAAGIRHLTIADDDVVEMTNLQRQIAHSESDLGHSKVESAANTLRGLNSTVELESINSRLVEDQLEQVVKNKTLVLDATDNF